MTIVDKYQKLNRRAFASRTPLQINTHVPSPTETDFERGYIRRIFIGKVNDPNAFIFEINSQELNRINSNPLYNSVTFDWRIIGTEYEVRSSNSRSLQRASKTLPNIKLYLPNLMQFARID